MQVRVAANFWVMYVFALLYPFPGNQSQDLFPETQFVSIAQTPCPSISLAALANPRAIEGERFRFG